MQYSAHKMQFLDKLSLLLNSPSARPERPPATIFIHYSAVAFVFPGAWPVVSDVALRAVIDSRINPRTTVFEYQINFTSWEAATELGWLAVSIDTFHRKCRGAGKCAGHGEITTTPEIMGMSWVSDLTSLGPAMVHASRLNGAEVEYKISSSVWEPATRLGTLFADNIDFVAERLLLFHEQHNEKPRPEGDYLNAWCP